MQNHKELVIFILYQMENMQDVLHQQKEMMKNVNLDKMD
jgi:hypothetical protein